ncbi:hypothetical protein SAMN04515618_11423 [Collimonas sp. OK307]|uniref:three component ABC system middle component n=1 Tax=Collimonas sp. OK307 TaxID=1801620 RepID=UPI0008EEB2D9|nr:three component ABC system middle component [Collimonas sp. OK307]SFI22287.1 hypothetical protein SAMN04515618_11423 [Collimonas sp. OK307]
MREIENEPRNNFRRSWDGYNNVGICTAAIASVLNHRQTLALPKVLLVMPLMMHGPTVSFMGNGHTRRREAAAFATSHPEFIANFNDRFESSLVVSVNAIQLLIHLGHAELKDHLVLTTPMNIDKSFGTRALRIDKASEKVAALLDSPVNELYLNFRIQL